jgi:hypothetical protein
VFGDSSTGSSFNLACPVGAHIIAFSGRAGAMMDAIGIKCSDGTSRGPVGGSGGSAVSTSPCADGYWRVEVNFVTDYGWNSIGGILLTCGTAQSSIMGYNSGTMSAFDCPAGQKLNGVTGTEGIGSGYYSHCSCQVVYSLRFACSTGKNSGPNSIDHSMTYTPESFCKSISRCINILSSHPLYPLHSPSYQH